MNYPFVKTQIFTFFSETSLEIALHWGLKGKGLTWGPSRSLWQARTWGYLLQVQLGSAGLCWKNPDSGKPIICHELVLSSFTSACWSPSPTSNSRIKTLWCFILKWDFITQRLSRQLNNKDFTISPKWSKCFVQAGMISYSVSFC